MEFLLAKIQERIKNNPSDLQIMPLATSNDIYVSEQRLGFKLPSALVTLYQEIGNGGFGPDYGVLGIENGMKDDLNRNAIELYESFHQDDPEEPLWKWKTGLLPICHLGCAMYICINCTDNIKQLTWFEPNGHEFGTSWDKHFIPLSATLGEWLQAWLDGKDYLEFVKEDNS